MMKSVVAHVLFGLAVVLGMLGAVAWLFAHHPGLQVWLIRRRPDLAGEPAGMPIIGMRTTLVLGDGVALPVWMVFLILAGVAWGLMLLAERMDKSLRPKPKE
jgi:hypothetical protein